MRNARGGNYPNVLQAANDIQLFGADGITVHPRPDERHIRYDDVRAIRPYITTELNIEGNPREQKFIDLVLEVKPHQVTLVPDSDDQLTSDHGWDTIKHQVYLTETISLFAKAGIRTSLFLDPNPNLLISAKETGTDRIELYTESYARHFAHNPSKAIKNYIETATLAHTMELGINAGHDLDRFNLHYFSSMIPHLDEVSIGHALISDALYLGLENAVQIYKRCLLI